MKSIDYWGYLGLTLLKLYVFSRLTETSFSLSFFFINLATILVMTAWVLLIPFPIRRWILTASLFLHSTLLISDIWYYRYFNNFLSVALLSDIGQMGDVEGGFLTLIEPLDFIVFADLLLFFILLWTVRQRSGVERSSSQKRLALVGTCLGIFLYAAPLASSWVKEERWLVEEPVSNMREYYQLGFWGYHARDAYRGAKEALGFTRTLSAQDAETIRALKDPASAATPKTNVILVQLESFQRSVIEQTVGGEAVTPNLNQLKDEMLYFPNIYHQTHEGRTSDAEFIVNTSLYPVKSGSVYTQYADHRFPSLSNVLREAGYDTAAMHAFKKDFWNRNQFYEEIDFNRFYSAEDYPDESIIGMALNDRDFLTTSVEHMTELDAPFFAFLVALTSHTPYDIPEEERRLDTRDIRDPLVANYYQTVRFVDSAVGTMVESLKAKNLWDESLVIFYGDHDSGLTAYDEEMASQLNVDTPVEQFELDRGIPLFIKPAGLTTGGTVEASGSQIDFAPTILDYLGLPTDYMLGQSLADETPNLTVFRDGSFRYDDYYFVPDLTKATDEGTCYAVSTQEKVAPAFCEPHIDSAIDQLTLSDTIIETNALDTIQP